MEIQQGKGEDKHQGTKQYFLFVLLLITELLYTLAIDLTFTLYLS